MLALLIAATLCGCVSIPQEARVVALAPGEGARVEHSDCTVARERARRAASQAPALDGRDIRVFTWNIHKQADAGLRPDLEGFIEESDLVLLQEVVLDEDMRATLRETGFRWAMGSSFVRGDADVGVLTASRVPPVALCTLRVAEPLLRLPKSAVLTWFALRGSTQTLAVVNVHAINFSLSLGAYREQLDAIVAVLAQHDGPIIFAGDLNTWMAGRSHAVRDAAAGLRLTEIHFERDRRKLFWGKQLDHIFVRGLEVTDADALPLETSDHYPVQATLGLAPPAH